MTRLHLLTVQHFAERKLLHIITLYVRTILVGTEPLAIGGIITGIIAGILKRSVYWVSSK